MVTIRLAQPEDEPALARVDFASTTRWSTPRRPLPDAPAAAFFGDDDAGDVLVAEVDGTLVGYARTTHPTPLPASRGVLMINGLGVDPAAQGRGVGRALVEGVQALARERGMWKVTLRVLGPNAGARALYERCGFVVEGHLRAEFELDGELVDDLLLAYPTA